MNKREQTILIILILTLASLGFLFSYKYVLYSQDFYEQEFENNGVYAKYDKTLVNTQHDTIMNYLVGKDKELKIKINDEEINNEKEDEVEGKENNKYGIEINTFSEQDILHLKDVKALMKKVDYYAYMVVIVMLLLFGYLHKFRKKIIDKIFTKALFYAGVVNLIFLGLIWLASRNFEWFFTKFHELSFNNDLWMMNPNVDMLVNIYPEVFWINAFTKIITIILMISIIYVVVGSLGMYFVKKHEELKHRKEKEDK